MPGPLDGITALDLGQIYQGPYCGMILSYLGADVVKVEPHRGDTIRDRSDDGETPEVQMLNPNKRGLALDLKTDAGKQAFLDLAEAADVVVENFSSGAMERLGLGYETLSDRNPGLVYAHGSGYGDSGPYTKYPAMDLTIQAMGGVIHATGHPDGPPVKTGAAIADFLGGIHLATGVVSALFERERTGEGQYVETGMFDCVYPTLTSPISAVVKGLDVPPRTGNRHSGMAIAPYNVYEASDGFLAIICIAERHWGRLIDLMERPDLDGVERFSSKAKRAAHMDEIDSIVGDWVADKRRDRLVSTLVEAGVPAAPVQSVEELIDDPHLAERGMLNRVENKGEGRDEVPVPGMPIRFSESEPPSVTPSPRIGEHSAAVLRDLAGYSDADLEALERAGAI